MSTRFTTESGSRYLISEGFIYRYTVEGVSDLGDKIQVSSAPFAVGERAEFVLIDELGEVYSVKTTPVTEVENVL